MDVLIKRFYL